MNTIHHEYTIEEPYSSDQRRNFQMEARDLADKHFAKSDWRDEQQKRDAVFCFTCGFLTAKRQQYAPPQFATGFTPAQMVHNLSSYFTSVTKHLSTVADYGANGESAGVEEEMERSYSAIGKVWGCIAELEALVSGKSGLVLTEQEVHKLTEQVNDGWGISREQTIDLLKDWLALNAPAASLSSVGGPRLSNANKRRIAELLERWVEDNTYPMSREGSLGDDPEAGVDALVELLEDGGFALRSAQSSTPASELDRINQLVDADLLQRPAAELVALLRASERLRVQEATPAPDLRGGGAAYEELRKAAAPFAAHYREWMDEFPDSDQSTSFPVHTLGQVKALHKALKAAPSPSLPVGGGVAAEVAVGRPKKNQPAATDTHCRNGHEWDEFAVQTSQGRKCRACNNEAMRRHRSQQAAPTALRSTAEPTGLPAKLLAKITLAIQAVEVSSIMNDGAAMRRLPSSHMRMIREALTATDVFLRSTGFLPSGEGVEQKGKEVGGE